MTGSGESKHYFFYCACRMYTLHFTKHSYHSESKIKRVRGIWCLFTLKMKKKTVWGSLHLIILSFWNCRLFEMNDSPDSTYLYSTRWSVCTFLGYRSLAWVTDQNQRAHLNELMSVSIPYLKSRDPSMEFHSSKFIFWFSGLRTDRTQVFKKSSVDIELLSVVHVTWSRFFFFFQLSTLSWTF